MQASAAPHVNRVSIDEFEKMLAATRGESDGKVAHQFAGVELTERASSARLARWEAEFPGRRCREILTELADNSALLDLPASEIPDLKAPDSNAQQAMIERMTEYAAKTINRLPNFYATRVTHYFEDTPAHETLGHMSMMTGRGMRASAMPSVNSDAVDYQPMHPTGVTSVPVTYRNGEELSGSKQLDPVDSNQPAKVLTTAGEFGPVLGVVLGDVRWSQINWAHWEQGPNGIEGVFRYSVPEVNAHYVVRLPQSGRIEQYHPAYHGEIAIDPQKGDVLRLSIVAELDPPNQEVKTAIVVEYATVIIGDKPYTCPIKSIALSRVPVGDAVGSSSPPMQAQLNDVAFTGYHLFRAEVRILTGPSPEGGEGTTTEGDPGK